MQGGETSRTIADRVNEARERQYARLGEGRVNTRMSTAEIERDAAPDSEGAKLLDRAMTHFSLSARVYHRILKVARTIADMDGEERIRSQHIAEALQYRGEHGMAIQ